MRVMGLVVKDIDFQLILDFSMDQEVGTFEARQTTPPLDSASAK
jgi:hypothetical protein